MTTPGDTEPSMEEILASIRRIISDDRKEQGDAKKTAEIVRDKANQDDVIELDQEIQEDGSIVSLKSQASPQQETFEKAPAEQISSSHKKEDLLSTGTIEASVEALKPLNHIGSSRPRGAPSTSQVGQRTVEDLVQEMLRPLLKEWLDANLPSLVRWVVLEQVEKVMKQKEKK